jgi:hypothetical protein
MLTLLYCGSDRDQRNCKRRPDERFFHDNRREELGKRLMTDLFDCRSRSGEHRLQWSENNTCSDYSGLNAAT